MSDFNNEMINREEIDPYKRVRYSMGLVLGVDEFKQEQAYFLEKNRLHNRALHGYGTVCGLMVSVRDREGKTEVVVDPGIAVAPAGQEIRVPSVQCGDIGTWFVRNQDVINKSLESDTKKSASKDKNLKVYVTLCYRECERDTVPLPGIACRSPEESMVNSRIEDSFELKFNLTPPPKHEEEIVRRFGLLLSNIEITPDSANYATSKEIEDLVRDLIKGEPGAKKLFISPEDLSRILRNIFRVFVTEVRPKVKGKDDTGKEVSCFSTDGDCVCLARLDIPVVKANNKISLKGGSSTIKVVTEDRPFLIHTRLLQEWMLCGKPNMSKVSSRCFATLFIMEHRESRKKSKERPRESKIRAWVHYKDKDLLDIPADAVRIEKNGNAIKVSQVEQVSNDTNVFDIYLKDRNKYPANGDRITAVFDAEKIEVNQQKLSDILPEMGNPYSERYGNELKSYLIADIPSLENLSDVNIIDHKDGDVLVHRNGIWTSDKLIHSELANLDKNDDHPQYLLKGSNAEGDLSGTYPAPTVVGLKGKELAGEPDEDGETIRWYDQGKIWKIERLSLPDLSDVNVDNKNIDDFLKWDGKKWIPDRMQAQVQALRYLPFATITQVGLAENGIVFEIWFNIDAVKNQAKITLSRSKNFIHVSCENNEQDSNYVNKVTINSLQELGPRNVFEIILNKEEIGDYLRFVFNLGEEVIQIEEYDKNIFTVLDYAKENNISFMGFDGKDTVTVFVKGKLNEM